ncbi:hypothetical protein O181_056772 [Austropuccinia psidii MF-1]|uniref:Uncharacterized protein n=1 Tax=Austropuccinia psidii MF-1 TaxID=1389203 RepID=A0A9Q3EBF0_9BASI|nr:hypothetical protein [Austropuccinia psidii MF-1]
MICRPAPRRRCDSAYGWLDWLICRPGNLAVALPAGSTEKRASNIFLAGDSICISQGSAKLQGLSNQAKTGTKIYLTLEIRVRPQEIFQF